MQSESSRGGSMVTFRLGSRFCVGIVMNYGAEYRNSYTMKILFTLLLTTVISITCAQSQFDNNTQVTATDGTRYAIQPLGASANTVRVMNASNFLHNEVKKYPVSANPNVHLQELYEHWLVTPLNNNFTKER